MQIWEREGERDCGTDGATDATLLSSFAHAMMSRDQIHFRETTYDGAVSHLLSSPTPLQFARCPSLLLCPPEWHFVRFISS